MPLSQSSKLPQRGMQKKKRSTHSKPHTKFDQISSGICKHRDQARCFSKINSKILPVGKKTEYQGNHFPPLFLYIYIYIYLYFFLTKSVSEPATQCVLAAQCHWSSPVATSAGSKEVTHVKQSDSTQKSSLKPAKDTRQNK